MYSSIGIAEFTATTHIAVCASVVCFSHYHFTGKERDAESGLDDFGPRYYSSNMGRFTSPDDFGGRFADPQTLNKYSYVGNNPLSRTDPTGHFWEQLKNFFGDARCWCNASQAAAHIQSMRDDLQTWQAKFDGKAPDYQHLTPHQARSYYDEFNNAAGAFAYQYSMAQRGSILGVGIVGLRVARAIPAHIPLDTLVHPASEDVFVTRASSLQGMNADQIADFLSIDRSATGFNVIEMAAPAGLASPVNRGSDYPAFVGGGKTAGGAEEFVIPNGPVPPGATVRYVPPVEEY